MTEVKSRPSLPDRALLDLALGPVEILEQLSVPVVVTRVAPGEGGPRIVFVNDAMVRLLGYRREDLLGQGADFWQNLDPETAENRSGEVALSSGRAVTRSTVALCKDGSRQPVRVEMVPHTGSWGLWVVTTALPLRDASSRTHEARDHRERPGTMRVGDLLLNVSNRRVAFSSKVAELTRSECVVLATLMKEAGCAVERAVIYEELWGTGTAIQSRAVDVYIGSLRRKLRELGAPDIIHTIRGVGYLIHD